MWRTGCFDRVCLFFFSAENSTDSLRFVLGHPVSQPAHPPLKSAPWADQGRESPHRTQSKNFPNPEFYLWEKLGTVGLPSWFKTKILQSKGSTPFSVEKSSCSRAGWSQGFRLADTGLPREATVFKKCISIICPKYITHFYQTVLTNRVFKIAFYGKGCNLLQCSTELDEKQFIWHNRKRSYGQFCQINKQ